RSVERCSSDAASDGGTASCSSRSRACGHGPSGATLHIQCRITSGSASAAEKGLAGSAYYLQLRVWATRANANSPPGKDKLAAAGHQTVARQIESAGHGIAGFQDIASICVGGIQV